jgi:hypothetical protein
VYARSGGAFAMAGVHPPNIGPALKKYSGRRFNIVSAQTIGRRGGLDPETQGLTDKVKPEIVFVEML